MILDI
ncbi:uncharacterized protein FPRN_15241 [Fusarium proliferatum]